MQVCQIFDRSKNEHTLTLPPIMEVENRNYGISSRVVTLDNTAIQPFSSLSAYISVGERISQRV